ncbi:Ribonuclease H [Klebsormidium nitens]|uniref:Ribonuclease n=1 Tax=Klebsormidium nitens TaxID=105231 RepID=A0A1Y1IEK7_KLENI|nr:Ribonuclease H [Klebsormidium nitens]|eukprot:GAQ87137.1 Ribonuclease H [Klebsormidium nitens]
MEGRTGEEPAWFNEPCILGIDEAGRGPVLGPMVYGCAFCALSQKARIAGMEFADSKTLTEEKRETLFEALKEDTSIGWAADVIHAKDLSSQMLRSEKKSLNAISHDSAMGLIRGALDKGVNLVEVYVDTVGDPEKYEQRLSEKFPGVRMTVRKKADSLFPIVSAASIVAKVTRDRALRAWVFEERGVEYGRQFGSGYPADPETKTWLAANVDPVFGFPSLVRFSWGTCKPLVAKLCVDVQWENDDEDESESTSARKNRRYESAAPGRHSYFKSRQLQQVTTHL